jgi:hypothetical protein
MNIFTLDYQTRLRAWHDLREKLKDYDIKQKCIEVDNFWQQCPQVAYYLHPIDIPQWPSPWELLADNNYCPYARALGMIYTLVLLGIKEVDLVDAKDDNSEDVALVLVDNAKYVLNYWPNTVVNNCLQDFTIMKRHDVSPIITKIGKP